MVGVLRMELNIGRSRTHGVRLGEKMDILEFKKVKILLEFKAVVVGVPHLIPGQMILETKQPLI
jgi:hypothetical protein